MSPFRRRSMVVKILLFVPLVWLGALIYFNVTDKPTEYQAEPQLAQKVREIQGFGPPMEVPKPKEADEPDNSNDKPPVLQKPLKKSFDQNSAIYKKGDPTQAGELGKAVKVNKNDLTVDERKIFDEGYKNNAFNQYASDMISIHRSLPPAADQECTTEVYSSDLPDTSVIICFHNEAWSVLLRTIHSVLERTPSQYLNEIILVDDFSDMEHTKKPLEEYTAQFPKVKVLRLEKREGLIRARLRGAAVAKGKVLTYLDSHCECMEGWLEPLLDRIHKNASTVVCPVIDVIDDDTFEYHYSKAFFTNVGGFDWSLQFNWHPIPERDRRDRKRAIDPVRSPTMAGGLFAIDRAYFEKLGTYDPGFDIWGGENLELSFKIWMCGGRLEIVPCSHVGHIFRKRSPYKWRTGVNVLKRNSIRLAEVWLDGYKKYYYERINNNLGDFGDISQRKSLRDRLECKSFKWYLDNIFPELFVPGDAVGRGEVRNGADLKPSRCLDSAVARRAKNKPVSLFNCHNQGGNQIRNGRSTGSSKCVDSAADEEHSGKAVVPYTCHGQGGNQVRNKGGGSKQCLDWAAHGNKKKNVGLYWCHSQGGNQYWLYSKDGEIRRDESCIDYAGKEVIIFPCHGMKGNQEWKYNHKLHQLLHVVSGKCLEMSKDGAQLQMKTCDTNNQYQHWTFQEYEEDRARQYGLI